VEKPVGGRSFRVGHRLRSYVHSGIFADSSDQQYDGASRHTDFYPHTLGPYLQPFDASRWSSPTSKGSLHPWEWVEEELTVSAGSGSR
jgi:hypothetical protein